MHQQPHLDLHFLHVLHIAYSALHARLTRELRRLYLDYYVAYTATPLLVHPLKTVSRAEAPKLFKAHGSIHQHIPTAHHG